MKQILVLGGGAAGMAAAIAAAQAAGPDVRVVLVEGGARPGKKLLATGNGRCNLANADIRPFWYFTADRKSLGVMLDTIQDRADPLKWFAGLGLLCRDPDEAGRIYPYSNQAADVHGLLLAWLERTGVEVLCDSKVKDLRQKGDHYCVQLEDGRQLEGQAVICALGGSAGPQFGTDGFGGRLARLLGLKVQQEYPCLVPLQCEKSQVQGLAGIRAKGDVTLYAGQTALRRESGEVQFTDYGLSGIAVMQLSGLFYPGQQKDLRIEVDLFPQMEQRQLAEMLAKRASLLPGATVADSMTGLLNRKLGLAVYRRCGLGREDRHVQGLTPAEWMRFAEMCKHWSFSGLVPLGWKNAQTTGGGIALYQLEPASFGLKGCPGLYFTGEMVDCAGSCGGFNLYWAFGSGILAGRSAAALCRGRRNGRPGPKHRTPKKK